MRRLGLFSLAALVASGSLHAAQASWETAILQKLDVGDIRYGTVVALQEAVAAPVKRKDGKTGPWNRMLVVDGRNIWEIDYVGVRDDPSVSRVRKRGETIDSEVAKLVADYVSWREAPFRAQWFTVRGTDYLLVLTWSVTRRARAAGAVFFIYCFASSEGRLRKVLEEEGDISLGSVDFCDMDGDGSPDLEISGKGESSISVWLNIWRMQGFDRAERIGLEGMEGFFPSVIASQEHGRCSVVTHAEHPEDGGLKTFIYGWDPAEQRFKLTSTRTEPVGAGKNP